MRSIPGPLATHYAQGSTSTAWLLRITRTDGQVFAFTSAAEDVTSIVLSAGLSVANLELTTLDDGTLFTTASIQSGRWNNAAVLISRYNWASPSDGTDPLFGGTIGTITSASGIVTAELRHLTQYLQQPVGAVVSANCRARLGDANCKVNLATYTHAATVTSVTSQQVFAASSLGQAADYFGNGLVRWTSGTKAGLEMLVKAHALGGVITLALPSVIPILVGDTFDAVAGCRQRHVRSSANPSGVSDCVDKFNNILNFQGEPHAPGVDALTSPP
jgi:uncharacterized phage protein (TIGR02218 family)